MGAFFVKSRKSNTWKKGLFFSKTRVNEVSGSLGLGHKLVLGAGQGSPPCLP